jgi:hypothetical protein
MGTWADGHSVSCGWRQKRLSWSVAAS